MEQVTVDVHLDGGAKVENRNPKTKTRNPKSETLISKPENRDPKPLIPRPGSRVAYFLALSRSLWHHHFVPACFSHLSYGTA